jgi:hypothetical protein
MKKIIVLLGIILSTVSFASTQAEFKCSGTGDIRSSGSALVDINNLSSTEFEFMGVNVEDNTNNWLLRIGNLAVTAYNNKEVSIVTLDKNGKPLSRIEAKNGEFRLFGNDIRGSQATCNIKVRRY